MSAIRYHHVVEGSSDVPVLVLADSIGTTLDMWRPQMAQLAGRFRIVRFDLPGHGGSPAPDGPYTIAGLGRGLIALLDELGIERAHLVGLSIGGMISMWVAAAAPERVDRLALLSTSALLGPPQGWASRAETVLAEGMAAITELVVGRWFTPAFVAAHPGLVAEMRAMLESVSPVGYAGCCRAIERMDLRTDLARIVAPTLVIVGDDDPATPPVHGEQLVAGIPDSRLARVADAAHLLNIEQPATVGRLLEGHLLAERAGVRHDR
jgi:3-oxoadipate enol-lactonase